MHHDINMSYRASPFFYLSSDVRTRECTWLSAKKQAFDKQENEVESTYESWCVWAAYESWYVCLREVICVSGLWELICLSQLIDSGS